jgi:Fe-S-cluster-containing hydrogenase component 2
MAIRDIVRINEDLCDGCGKCIPDCVEGALKLVNGKAKLVKEIYCDGLGACLGSCPRGAITIEKREANEFDEEATRIFMEQKAARPTALPIVESISSAGCPGMAARQLRPVQETRASSAPAVSTLGHWPVQLSLVSPEAPYFQDAELLLTADCVPVSVPDFHSRFLKGHAIALACPKLDDIQPHLDKLIAILLNSDVRAIKVLRMEVPCCSGLTRLARAALQASGKEIPLQEITITVDGQVKEEVQNLTALA